MKEVTIICLTGTSPEMKSPFDNQPQVHSSPFFWDILHAMDKQSCLPWTAGQEEFDSQAFNFENL